MVADKLFNSSLKLKVLVALALVAGLLVVVPSAQSQEHSSPVLSASQVQSPSDPCSIAQEKGQTGFFAWRRRSAPTPLTLESRSPSPSGHFALRRPRVFLALFPLSLTAPSRIPCRPAYGSFRRRPLVRSLQ
jgi:hypothetical protein